MPVGKHSVESRMLGFIAIDQINPETSAAVEFHSPSLIAINRHSRSRRFLVEEQVSSKCSVTHCGIKELAPRARFELATLRLTAECSTVELPGNSARCFAVRGSLRQLLHSRKSQIAGAQFRPDRGIHLRT